MLFKLGNWGAVFILAIAMSATPALATTWIVPDADSMAESADAVVLATVESIRGIESFDGSEITTAITLHVKEGYKGAVAGERLVLHEVGGQVGGNTQWAFGSPEYEVGATVVAYVERTGLNRLRTKHMAIGKLDAEIRDDGEVVLSGVGRHGTVRRESLNSFRRSIPNRARARGSVRVAGRLQAQEPRVEGIAQATSTFRLLQPASRWFSFPVSVFGDLAGDSKLGKAVANRVVEEGSEVWADQMGSEFTAEYKGNRQGKGFTCNSGFTSVSFDDPKNQIGNPTGCAGALAVGGFCSTSTVKNGSSYREITGGAIVFADGWEGCYFWNEKNLKEIMTHEFGHAIGFAHSWDSHMGSNNDSFIRDATMFWMAHFDGRGAHLADYEKGAVALLYEGDGPVATPAPTPAATPVPTPVPTPRPDSNDSDRDGVEDTKDNCPDLANAFQGDADQDGIGDACDSCDLSSDPNAICRPLAGQARITRDQKGRVKANVRAHFAPWIENVAQDFEIDMISGNSSIRISVPAAKIAASNSGNRGRFRADQVSIGIRKYKNLYTRFSIEIEDPELAQVLDSTDLTIRVRVGGTSASAEMPCSTRPSGKRIVTACEAS